MNDPFVFMKLTPGDVLGKRLVPHSWNTSISSVVVILGYTRLRCVDETSRRCSDDDSGGGFSSPNSNSNFYETRPSESNAVQNNVIQNNVNQNNVLLNVNKNVDKMSSGEEDEMEDTVSPLAGGQVSFDANKPSPR